MCSGCGLQAVFVLPAEYRASSELIQAWCRTLEPPRDTGEAPARLSEELPGCLVLGSWDV